MNRALDMQSCAICRTCYRRNTPQCNDACRRCGIAMFSDDEVNIYPYSESMYGDDMQFGYFNTYGHIWPYTFNYPFGYPKHSPVSKSQGQLATTWPYGARDSVPAQRLYYNYPRVTNQYYPSMLPYGNYYGSLYRPSITYW